jgi:hypothetical protein
MGRCNCINGQRLGGSMEQVEPLPDINAMAKSEGRDCVYITDRWASRLNGRPDPNPSPEIIKQVENLMKRSREEQQTRSSRVKSAGELFADEIDALTIGVTDGK